MSQFYSDLVWADSSLKRGRFTIMLALARHANADGRCNRSQRLLAEETRLTERQIRRLIQDLSKDDYLAVEESGVGRGNTAIYQLFPLVKKADIGDTKAEEMSAFRPSFADLKEDKMSAFIDSESSLKADIGDTKEDKMSAFQSHARSGWLVGSPSSPRRRKKPTNQPSPPLADAHQQLAFDLLVDLEVGIEHDVAEILARKLPAQVIYKAVERWLPDYLTGKAETGLLVYRLGRAKPTDAPTVTLSPDFRNSDVYRRHPLPAEMVRDPTMPHPSDYTDFDF